MTISREDMRELKGTKIKIDGELHVVHKAVMRSGVITTEDGIEVNAEHAEKKGKFWCFPAPRKSRTKTKEEPTETVRQRRAREKREAAEAEIEETPRQRRAREKREAAEAEEQPVSRRGRNRTKPSDATEPATTRVPRGTRANAAKGAGTTRPESKKKKLVEAFDQALAEHIGQEVFDLVSKHYPVEGKYGILPVAVGGDYSTEGVKVVLTLLPDTLTDKQIKAYIRDHREATDISPADEEDDDLDDLEDDDNEDELELDVAALLEGLDVLDLKKIARKLGLTTKKSMDADAVIALIDEDDDADEEAIRAAAEDLEIELADDESSDDDDDLEDDEDDDGEDDESDDDDDSDEDDESDDDEDDDDEDEEEEEEPLTVDAMVEAIMEVAPELKQRSVKKFVEDYLASEEVEGALGDDLAPGFSKLQEKGGEGPEFLLIGYDTEKEQIKLLNLDTLKTRSKDLLDVVHMDVLEEEDEEDDE